MAWAERYVDASAAGGGTGTSTGDPWTLLEAFSNTAAGMRVNIKAGTYTLTSQQTVPAVGSQTDPVWWRGYVTTPGDLDGKLSSAPTDSTGIPLIQTNNNIVQSSNYFTGSGLSFLLTSGNRSYLNNGSQGVYVNCKFRKNAASNSASVFGTSGRDFFSFHACEFVVDGQISTSLVSVDIGAMFHSCVFKSEVVQSSSGATSASGNRWSTYVGCVFDNLYCGLKAPSGGSIAVIGCTFVDMVDYGISVPQGCQGANITGNYFSNIGGFVIGNSTGTTPADAWSDCLIATNVYQNVGGQLENVANDRQFTALTDASDSFTDSSSGDYSLTSSSAGYEYGLKDLWGIGSTDYTDIGAVQHQGGSGGGTTVIVIEDD